MTWRAEGSLRNPQLAIDGNLSTAAVSEPLYAGAFLTIDLGKPCLFNMVVLDHGSDEHGHARKVALLTSMDGKSYTRQLVASGTRRVTTLSAITLILARYVRLQAAVPGDQPWSIAEVYLQ